MSTSQPTNCVLTPALCPNEDAKIRSAARNQRARGEIVPHKGTFSPSVASVARESHIHRSV